MSIKIVQPGSGTKRDLAILYLVGSKAADLAAELGPEVCVVAENASKYNAYGDGGITPWQSVIHMAQAQDPFELGDIWLIGFSAGTQGARTQLWNGCKARYIIACDGIHLPKGTPTSEQWDTWKMAYSSAVGGALSFSVSCSKTPTYDFKSTRDSAEELFGIKPCFGSPDSPCMESKGAFRLYGATTPTLATDPKGEHMAQLHHVLPRMIRDAKSGAVPSGNWPWYLTALAAGFIVGFEVLLVSQQELFAVVLEYASPTVWHGAFLEWPHDKSLTNVLPERAVPGRHVVLEVFGPRSLVEHRDR